MNECIGLIGHLLGHKFEPRYDATETERVNLPDARRVTGVNAMKMLTEAVRPLVKEIYVQDVCVRCGIFVKRA